MVEEVVVEAMCSYIYPCLWQASSKGYKDLRAKEVAGQVTLVQ